MGRVRRVLNNHRVANLFQSGKLRILVLDLNPAHGIRGQNIHRRETPVLDRD